MKGGSHSFEWDTGNAKKCEKHGVSIAEIESLFGNMPIVYPNVNHAGAEVRYSAIGRNAADRGVFVVYTLRQRDGMHVIRPISARYMHKKEINYYESL